MSKMLFQFLYTPSTLSSFFSLVLICFLLIISHGYVTAADGDEIISLGAIIDDKSRAGKEQKTAMKIAVQNFNSNSSNHKFTVHFRNTSGEPLKAAIAAEQLIKDAEAQVIIGTQTWQEAALVADIGSRAQVPFLSLAAAAITPPLTQIRWPFLVQMATNSSQEMKSIAAIIQSYNWRRVITVYEDNAYGGDSGALALLSEALQNVGSEIEHRLVLPPFSSLLDPEGLIREEVAKLLGQKSRVFIIIQSSMQLATHLFREAKKIGLMGRDSVWIINDSISSLLDSVESSVVTSMEGVVGTKSYFSEEIKPFLDFKAHFRQIFRSDYPGEDNVLPGFHALRAYDSIMVIAQAVTKLGANNRTSRTILKSILSSNFNGLSGNIRFHNGSLSNSPVFRIINVVGKSYKELGFWSSEFGFSNNIDQVTWGDSMKTLTGNDRVVNWPGDLTRVPKGWTMPTDAKKMKIGIPGRNAFEKFVKVEPVENSDENRYTGFCIEVFYEVLKVLNRSYPLPYEFIPYNGSYDSLVEHVINKTYDAVVGDITILANRSKYVEFTMPFAESGLSMLVQVKHDHHKAWMFLRPFTVPMWLVTLAILLYTMFIVWILEHRSENAEFEGSLKDQLGTAFWFTFSSLFFAHREKVKSNFTKIVVVMWLFVVLILSSSYTASLSSMLTVPKLEPKVKDIDWLRDTNAVVGCDEDSFVKDYLRNILNLKNLKTITNQDDYPKEFESWSIKAAFLELPYLKVFLEEYNGYTAVGPTYRFGGLGFVFQKGSPLAIDVSEAILAISENGVLQGLEKKWFPSSQNCSNSANETDSLTLKSFWGIYLISGVTSTVCLLIFLVKLLFKKYFNKTEENRENDNIPSEVGAWRKAIELVRYLHDKKSRISPGRAPSFKHAQDKEERSSSRWELVSPSETAEHPIRPTQIEIPIRNDMDYIVNHIER